MFSKVKDQLTSVRVRQQFKRGFQTACLGLLVGAAIGCVILVLQRSDLLATGPAAWFAVIGCSLAGFAMGLAWPTSWGSTARLVDSACGLKDRSLTAVDFSQRKKRDELQELQVQDALDCLGEVDAAKVVPFGVPKYMTAAICTLAVMVAVAMVPQKAPAVVVVPEALPVVLEQAKLLEDTLLDELEELAQEHEDEELEQLAEEIKKAIEELQEPEVDQREALAKLSEMQQAIAEMQQQLSVEEMDAQLEQLAEALQAADATQAASQSLKANDYDQAAAELEKIDASTMERKEREAVASNLAKLSKKLGEGKKGQLSEAVAEMAEGLDSENQSQCKSGMCKAAGLCKKQGIRKKISQCLNCQLNRLSECKSCCQGNCSKPGGQAKKSNTPRNTWGTAASGKPLGEEKTNYDTTRREENLTGVAGDGPSERETLSTPEARQDAARAYKERYADFKKQMEEVLDSEPLPLGHRKTVRDYFESIRPENGQEVLN